MSTESKPANERPIRMGGLMRCCIAGGVMGPGVEQIECPDCYARVGEVTR